MCFGLWDILSILNHKKIWFLVFLLLVPSLSAITPMISAVEGDPTPIGFEFLDSGNALRIWNEIDSYYFNVSSGIQFSNHYNEYWSRNILGLGYYSGGEWHVIYWTDELSNFKKDLSTDWETYINITLWRDLSYLSYDFRLAIRYNLKTMDPMLTIQPYIKNLGQDIPFDVGFAWKLKDIKIKNTFENDQIFINNTHYFLNQTIDLTYKNMTIPITKWKEESWNGTAYTESYESYYPIPEFQIKDQNRITQILKMKWNPNLKYAIKVKSIIGQHNAPITFLLNVGPLLKDQEKTTNILWKDATEDFTTYTEVDPNNHITLNATHIDHEAYRNEDAYVYDDKGAGHFTDFVHLIDIQIFNTTHDAPICITWMLSNNVNDLKGIKDASQTAVAIKLEGVSAAVERHDVRLVEEFNGTEFSDFYRTDGWVWHYLTINKTGTSLTCEIYSDGARTILVDTLSLTLQADHSLRYVFGCNTWNSGHAIDSDNDIRNLDLQEVANNAPATESATIGNMDDSDDVLSQYKNYNFNFTVSDADGPGEIHTLNYSLEIGANWINGTIQAWNGNAHSFYSGGTRATVGVITNTTNGNYNRFIVPIRFDWDAWDVANNDIHLWCNDTSGDPSGWTEEATDYFDSINDLVTNSIECTDADDPDRVDVSATIGMDFSVRYENEPGSGVASAFYPPDAEFTSISVYDEWDNVLGTDSSIVNGAGSVSGTANASVQETDYNLYLNMSDADYSDGEETPTEAVRTDRGLFYSIAVNDTRVDVDANTEARVQGELDYDQHALGSGDTVQINGTGASWDAGNSWFDAPISQSSVVNMSIDVTSLSEASYTITEFTRNVSMPTVVWDRQQLQTLGVNDTTPEQNQPVRMWLTCQSEYTDNHLLNGTDGDEIELRDSDSNVYVFSWNGTHWYNVTSWAVNDTYVINNYEEVNETTYDISVLDMNSLSLSITVGSGPSGYGFDLRTINSTEGGIEGARVLLANSTDTIFSLLTNSTGFIAQQNVASGNYTLTITMEGYMTYEHELEITQDLYLIVRIFTLDEGAQGIGGNLLFLIGLMFVGIIVMTVSRKR